MSHPIRIVGAGIAYGVEECSFAPEGGRCAPARRSLERSSRRDRQSFNRRGSQYDIGLALGSGQDYPF